MSLRIRAQLVLCRAPKFLLRDMSLKSVTGSAECHLSTVREGPLTSRLDETHRTQQRASFVTKSASSEHVSPFDAKSGKYPSKKKGRKLFIPRKAAVQLTDKARNFFQLLLTNAPRPEIIGIMLTYEQSKTGEPRMVFSFQFVTADDIEQDDEPVSLEVTELGKPKSPADAWNDGLPKLYVSQHAFLKVLGATVDVDPNQVTPILHDREGNRMDPNA